MSDQLRTRSTSMLQHSNRTSIPTKFANLENVRRVQSLRVNNSRKSNDASAVIEELVQCSICSQRLNQPRMLPCQHTFCLSCLETHIIARNLVVTNPSIPDMKQALEKNDIILSCLICKKEVILNNGLKSLDELPSNLYINSLLSMLKTNSNTPNIQTLNVLRCKKCQIVCESYEHKCQHCQLIFCKICWPDHIQELKNKIPEFLKQLTDSEHHLNFKYEDYERRQIQLNESVILITEDKIANIREDKENILNQIEIASAGAKLSSEELLKKLNNAKNEINLLFPASSNGEQQQVSSYIKMHKDISKLLDEVSLWGETRLIFDPDSFELEVDETSLNCTNNQILTVDFDPNDLESNENLEAYYKNRIFDSKLLWNRCPKSAGIGVPPWSQNLLYIAAFVSKKVIILDINNKTIIGNLNHDDMICPYNITFHEGREEIFVSDKSKHCVHVFSKKDEYLRSIGSRGHGNGQVLSPQGISIQPNGDLLLCDTGNNRVLVLNSENGNQITTVGSDLNMPTNVAHFGDTIIIADSGNYRIKIYNLAGEKIKEFGFAGSGKGQFRFAEVVAVDPLGFILVGDSGNGRIQIFDPNGNFVRMFHGSSSNKFKWISGIAVTRELNIIVTDFKGRSLQIF